MTIRSMTGFASSQGSLDAHSWSWEIRSVNAKGLDLRLRVPDWLDGLEQHLRSQLTKALARGNVSLSLRITHEEESGQAVRLNQPLLQSILSAMAQAQKVGAESGVVLAQSSVADILAIRGVLEQDQRDIDPAPLVAALKKDFETLVADFVQMRDAEGAALDAVLRDQLNQIQELRRQATERAEDRRAQTAANLRNNLTKVVDSIDAIDADRLAQELALIAVKSDITEELDRLSAHIDAAGRLLDGAGAVGRKFDFLMQEFNREANTLCSKAQNSALTAVGLEMKAIIDQMREQVQNIE